MATGIRGIFFTSYSQLPVSTEGALHRVVYALMCSGH